MLLRSLSKHVKEQNWFAVLLDFVIVVVGVFIGIQVSNWNDEWAGEKQAYVLIERMKRDIQLDLEVLENLLNYQTIVNDYAVTAIQGFDDDGSVSDEQFVISAYQASQVNLPTSYRATYTELLSTGQINLIKNTQIKEQILHFYSDDWAKRPNMVYLAPYRAQIRRLMPHVIQDNIRTFCGDYEVERPLAKRFTLKATCDLALPEELFQKTAEFLRNQPELLLDLQHQISVYSTQVQNMDSTREQVKLLFESLSGFNQDAKE